MSPTEMARGGAASDMCVLEDMEERTGGRLCQTNEEIEAVSLPRCLAAVRPGPLEIARHSGCRRWWC
jgi:hypothetical protein